MLDPTILLSLQVPLPPEQPVLVQERMLQSSAGAQAERIGAAFIVLDALNADAARLYRRFGFEDLPGHEPRMLIGMKVVRTAIARTAPPAAQSA